MKCKNVDRECKWEGTVGTLEAHVATCEFTLLPCSYQCKDDKNEIAHFMRKDLDKHLDIECPNRYHACEYCGEENTYTYMTQVHDKQCGWKPVPCRNTECSHTTTRLRMEEHLKECGYTEVPCPNTDCPYTTTRLSVEVHLKECAYSEVPCKYQRLGCDVRVMRKDMPAHEEDEKLHLHMALDKVVSMEEKVATMEEDIAAMKNENATNILANGGAITFKLADFQDKKDQKVVTYFPAFYSSPKGYHMQVYMYSNGVGSGEDKYVSVYVHILEGKYDAELKWPFVGNITVQILNQLEDSGHYEIILHMTKEIHFVVRNNKGYIKFITHSELGYDIIKNTQYLKDDTLYFRVSVDIPNQRPWLECTAK